jgi:GTP-binding protein EngB required for normal cell division
MSYIGSFIILGNTQCGKSSFINCLAGKELAGVGNGDGISVTSTSANYSFYSPLLESCIQIVDIPGFGDTRTVITNEQIALEIKKCIGESLDDDSYRFLGFLLVESIHGESFSLAINLDRIFNIAGVGSQDSIIVIANKSDMLPIMGPQKYAKIGDFCERRHLSHVKWSNKTEKLNDNELQQQIMDLQCSIMSLSPYKGAILLELDQEIIELALILSENQKPPSESDIENKAKELAAKAPMIPITNLRPERVEKIKVVKWNEVKRRGGIEGLFGGKRTVEHSREEKYYEDQMVPYIEYQPPPFENFLNIARKNFEVPFEIFIEKAKTIISEDIKKLVVS